MESTEKRSRRHSKTQARLNELIHYARLQQIEVRTERLLREVGYRVVSGSCRLNKKQLIILDRDLAVRDQVDLLAGAIRHSLPDPMAIPPHLADLL